ncbi:hypothetical protein ES705_27476 [subsurface metagenome]
MTITRVITNSHGRHHIRFRPLRPIYYTPTGTWYRVSPRTGRRLAAVFCPRSGCPNCDPLIHSGRVADPGFLHQFGISLDRASAHSYLFIARHHVPSPRPSPL